MYDKVFYASEVSSAMCFLQSKALRHLLDERLAHLFFEEHIEEIVSYVFGVNAFDGDDDEVSARASGLEDKLGDAVDMIIVFYPKRLEGAIGREFLINMQAGFLQFE